MPSSTRQARAQEAPVRPAGRRTRGRTLGERQRERREAMLAAGFDLIGTRGFDQTRIEDVCRRAGVSTRNFYEEFDDRHDLLAAVDEQLVAALFAAWSGPTGPGDDAGDGSARAMLRARVAKVVQVVAGDPRVGRVTFVEAVGVSPRHEARRRELLGVFPAWLEAYMKGRLDAAGVPARRQHRMAVAAFAGAYELVARWALQPLSSPDRADPGELVDDIVAIGTSIFRAG